MASIFSDLSNIRKPDVIMNMGPVPRDSLPGPFNATTNAQINYGSTLLGDLSPYEFGEPNRLSSQTAYMNIPHKIQKIIPVLRLPEARSSANAFLLSHGVDDGDVAFSLRVDRKAGTIEKLHTFERMELSHAVDPFVNLATVNYLLAGIQRNWHRASQTNWQQFMVDTDFAPRATQARQEFSVRHALRFIQDVARPFGIAHGSERQGGQHEGSTSAVTYPVNFVTSLLISGRVENLINMWRESDISAGDDLIFHLAWLPICKEDNSHEYVLNHWGKGLVRQRFDWEHTGIDGTPPVNFGWQLVPAVHDLQRPYQTHEGYDFREHGYWHIARTQVMKGKEVTQKLEREQRLQMCYNDDSRFLRGSLLEATFEPVFVQIRRMKSGITVAPLVPPQGPRIQRRRHGGVPGIAPPPQPAAAPPAPHQDAAQGGPPPAGGGPGLPGRLGPIMGAEMPTEPKPQQKKPRKPTLAAPAASGAAAE